MKIINWNCKMNFRKDCQKVFDLNPDILVVPECEDINKYSIKPKVYSDSYWIGDNQNKGLAVFTFNNFKIKPYYNYNENYKYVLPLEVSNVSETYNLIAVWTKKVGEKTKQHSNYIRQVNLSFNDYDSFIQNNNSIICGDFNSNLFWLRTGIDKDHQWLLDYLEAKNIYSSYHKFKNEEQGQETQGTYFHYHKENRPFHIDFCFLSKNLINRMKSVKLGNYSDWINISDHVPMIVELY